MNICRFEDDVLDALASHRWPARAGDELRAHVASCESCASLATTASALMSEHDVAFAGAQVPLSAAVWHRAQLRAREDAGRTAMRPIGFVQGFAFACGVALMLAVAAWGLPLLADMAPDMSGIVAWFRTPSLASEADVPGVLLNPLVQIAVAGWVLVAPVALYFALARE